MWTVGGETAKIIMSSQITITLLPKEPRSQLQFGHMQLGHPGAVTHDNMKRRILTPEEENVTTELMSNYINEHEIGLCTAFLNILRIGF